MKARGTKRQNSSVRERNVLIIKNGIPNHIKQPCAGQWCGAGREVVRVMIVEVVVVLMV